MANLDWSYDNIFKVRFILAQLLTLDTVPDNRAVKDKMVMDARKLLEDALPAHVWRPDA